MVKKKDIIYILTHDIRPSSSMLNSILMKYMPSTGIPSIKLKVLKTSREINIHDTEALLININGLEKKLQRMIEAKDIPVMDENPATNLALHSENYLKHIIIAAENGKPIESEFIHVITIDEEILVIEEGFILTDRDFNRYDLPYDSTIQVKKINEVENFGMSVIKIALEHMIYDACIHKDFIYAKDMAASTGLPVNTFKDILQYDYTDITGFSEMLNSLLARLAGSRFLDTPDGIKTISNFKEIDPNDSLFITNILDTVINREMRELISRYNRNVIELDFSNGILKLMVGTEIKAHRFDEITKEGVIKNV